MSDRDRLFVSKFWESLTSICGITRLMSTPYHPQTDGQSEKTNQTVEVALRHYVDDQQLDWVSPLHMILFAINTSKHDSTGVSPYEALYGVNVRDCFSELTGLVSNTDATEFARQQNRVRQRVSASLQFAQACQSLMYNAKHKLKEFNVGDYVMFNMKDYNLAGHSKNKLAARRVGPFRILERHGRLAYKLDLPAGYRMHPVFSVAKLEPAVGRDLHTRPPAQLQDLSEESYKIKKILSQGYVDGALRYQIKWSGYNLLDATWEDAARIAEEAPAVVAD